MAPDLDAIEENFCEWFIDRCWNDATLSNLCYEYFANSVTQYFKWKICDDSNDEYVYGETFDALFEYDPEGLGHNPIKTLQNYMQGKK